MQLRHSPASIMAEMRLAMKPADKAADGTADEDFDGAAGEAIRPHAPSVPMRSAPAYFHCKWGV
jgi:hypothetical protein